MPAAKAHGSVHRGRRCAAMSRSRRERRPLLAARAAGRVGKVTVPKRSPQAVVLAAMPASWSVSRAMSTPAAAAARSRKPCVERQPRHFARPGIAVQPQHRVGPRRQRGVGQLVAETREETIDPQVRGGPRHASTRRRRRRLRRPHRRRFRTSVRTPRPGGRRTAAVGQRGAPGQRHQHRQHGRQHGRPYRRRGVAGVRWLARHRTRPRRQAGRVAAIDHDDPV